MQIKGKVGLIILKHNHILKLFKVAGISLKLVLINFTLHLPKIFEIFLKRTNFTFNLSSITTNFNEILL